MDRRPNIFIASSQEALPIARAVKRQFDDEADVDVWAEDIFKANRNYLDTLNRASYYDYFVAVFAPDDAVTVRKKAVKVTRDNVIFEFGLFLGRLGPNRTFLILHEGVDLFSDWSGIDIATFRPRPDGNLVAAVGAACEKIRAQMKDAEKLPNFTSLPSTALAMGYYNNFLKKVFEAFEHTDSFSVVERDKRGRVLNETTHRITDRRPTIHVQLPQHLQDLEDDRFKERTSAYRLISVVTPSRNFPFYIGSDPKRGARKMNLFDIPTTMLSSKIAIERVFTPEFLAQGRTAQALESREIANFERTLRMMVPDKFEKKYFKFSVLK